jgi:hypothetical protein
MTISELLAREADTEKMAVSVQLGVMNHDCIND